MHVSLDLDTDIDVDAEDENDAVTQAQTEIADDPYAYLGDAEYDVDTADGTEAGE